MSDEIASGPNVSLIYEHGDRFPTVINEDTGERIRWITNIEYTCNGEVNQQLVITVIPKRIILKYCDPKLVSDAALANWPDSVTDDAGLEEEAS